MSKKIYWDGIQKQDQIKASKINYVDRIFGYKKLLF